MSNQPEALRLADELEMWTLGEPAAAELRRLHAENERLAALVCDYAAEEAPDALRTLAADRDRWHAKAQQADFQRDALLEACRFYASMMGRRKSDGEPFYMTALDLDCGDRARAAIKAAEGEKA